MEKTKKEIAVYCNQILYYFKKMFETGGSYKEANYLFSFKIIKIKFKNKMIVRFPMTQQEYIYWRSIKPKLKKGDKI